MTTSSRKWNNWEIVAVKEERKYADYVQLRHHSEDLNTSEYFYMGDLETRIELLQEALEFAKKKGLWGQ